MSDKCPSCGEKYINHLGLIGMCYRLKEAVSCVDELEGRIANISTDWIVNQEKLEVMREVLEWICDTEFYAIPDTHVIKTVVSEALQRAGGGE